MSKVLITEDYLEDIADAIRSKNGTSDTYTPAQMGPAIEAIPTGGGGGTEDATATAADILNPKTAYIASGKVTGQIQSKTASTYTPTTTNQVIASGVYLSGSQTILGDTNLVPSKIANGVTIFGVEGTYEGGGIDPSDATATAGDILASKTAYIADGTKATGTIPTITLPTSATTTNPSVTNKATIGRSTSNQYVKIAKGYNAADAQYTISAVANGTVVPSSTITGTGATLTTGTNTITLAKTVSNTPNVSTAGYISAGTAGNSSVSLTATATTKAATTHYATSSETTPVAAGTYCTGAQKVAAVTTTNLTAENIKNGVTVTVGDSADADRIASVTGTYTGGGGSTVSVVHGTFTTQSSAGVQSVTIPYTGSGYPLMCYVVIKGGAYVSGTTWYNSTQRYAIGVWACSKSVMSSAPTYGTSGTQNQAVTMSIYKNSTSSSTSYSRTSAMNTNTFTSSNATNAAATAVRFKGNAKTLSVYVNTSSYGLFPSQDYEYWVVYSS